MPRYMAFLTSVRVSGEGLRSRPSSAGRDTSPWRLREEKKGGSGQGGEMQGHLSLNQTCQIVFFIGRENARSSKIQSPGSSLLSAHWSEHIVELHRISASLQLEGEQAGLSPARKPVGKNSSF